jgi:hypothetical protein
MTVNGPRRISIWIRVVAAGFVGAGSAINASAGRDAAFGGAAVTPSLRSASVSQRRGRFALIERPVTIGTSQY